MPSDGGTALSHAISAGTASAVSDGSYNDSRRARSSAFIITPNKDKGMDRSEGASFATGFPEEQSAYRSGLAKNCL